MIGVRRPTCLRTRNRVGCGAKAMRLYFIRHAQSTNNALVDRTGSEDGRSHDPPLTDIGHKQASIVAAYLAAGPTSAAPPGQDGKDLLGFGITHLYCSLMDRAIVTARHISRELGLPLRGHPELHEAGGLFLDDPATGKRVGLPGRSASELRSLYPELVLPPEVGEEGWWNRPFEAYEERAPRARRVVDMLLGRHGDTDDHVCVVSHGDFFNWVTTAILGLETKSPMWLDMNNTAITRFDISGGFVVVRYLNRTDHLPPELIT
jgi:2,3-bisphosphoglycerate-dependent phosphoglycerate mutase